MATIDRYAIQVDTSQANSAISGLTAALGGLAAAFSVREITQFADSITSVKNRLLTLTPDIANVERQFKALAAIAIEARTPLEATSDLYFRIARASRELGISQKEAADITSSVAKAISSSGMSAQEAAGPLLQLGQALQSGRFQGDELRSILEGMPVVAQAMADSLGVPIGALKEMGSQGQITGQVFVEAMRKAKGSIDEAFGRTNITIGQALTNLKTQLAIAGNEFENNTNTGRTLALTIEYIGFQIFKLSKSIDSIIGPLTTFLKIAGALVAFTVVGRILSWVGGIITASINLWNRFGASLSLAKDLVMNFSKSLAAAGGNAASFFKIIELILKPFGTLIALAASGAAAFFAWTGIDKVFESIRSLGDSSSDAAKEMAAFREEQMKFAQGLSTDIPEAIDRTNLAIASIRDELNKNVDGYKNQIVEQQRQFQLQTDLLGLTEEQRIAVETRYQAEQDYLNAIKPLMEEYAKLSKSKNADDLAKLPEISVMIQEISDAYAGQLPQLEALIRARQEEIIQARELKELQKQLEESAKRRAQVEETISDYMVDGFRKVREEAEDYELEGLTGINRKLKEIEIQERRLADAAKRRVAEQMGDDLSGLGQAIDQIDAASKRIIEQRQAQAEAVYKEQRSFATGWKKAFEEYADEATNAAKAAERIFQRTTKGMEDAIVGFAKTGKFEFRSFMNSILEELLRSQVRQLIAQIFSIGGTGKIGGSGGGGGFFGSVGKLLGFANGGIIPTNSPVLVGERGPEILSGAAGRVVTPNEQLGFGTTNVVYNISAVDARSFKELVASDPSFIYAVTEQGRRTLPSTRR